MFTADVIYPPILAVDFDGTITKYNNYKHFSYNDPPMEDAVDVLNRLYRDGCVIIINSCRCYLSDIIEAKNYLLFHGIPFDFFNKNVPWLGFDSRKVYGDYYIDDKNIFGFPGWLVCEREIRKHPFFTAEGERMKFYETSKRTYYYKRPRQ